MTRLDEERDGGSWLYLAIGWAAAAMAPLVFQRGGKGAVAFMAAGGALYTGGFAVLASRRPDPVPGVFGYHEVWHTLVLAAGLCHAEMLRRVVAGAPGHPPLRHGVPGPAPPLGVLSHEAVGPHVRNSSGHECLRRPGPRRPPAPRLARPSTRPRPDRRPGPPGRRAPRLFASRVDEPRSRRAATSCCWWWRPSVSGW